MTCTGQQNEETTRKYSHQVSTLEIRSTEVGGSEHVLLHGCSVSIQGGVQGDSLRTIIFISANHLLMSPDFQLCN